jgi:hypothetical protein
MFMRRGALGTAESAVLLSGAVKTRGAMMRKPDADPSTLIHRNSYAWVGHAVASAATTHLVY